MPTGPDGAQVHQRDAIRAWAEVAHPYLIDAARLRTVVQYKELALYVQRVTQISTRQLIQQWIGQVLGEVSDEAERRGEPHLVSLCVSTTGEVGAGYLWAPAGASSEERNAIAQRDREECYARYAAPEGMSEAALLTTVVPTEDDLEAVEEGGLALREHFVRERDRGLRKRKIEAARRDGIPIVCEACGFDFGAVYGDRGRDYCEVHHRTPLHESGPTSSRLADLAILCANCHRMIHRGATLSVEELVALVRR